MIGILITILMLACLLYGVKKNYNLQILMLSISVIVLLGYSLITGNSVAAETTGNSFWDVFHLIEESFFAQVQSVGLIVMAVMGYVTYLEKMGAAPLFAAAISKPLVKLKKPYLIAGAMVAAGAFIKLAFNAGSTMTAMLLGVLYPMLIACGLSAASVSVCIIMMSAIVWGPAEGLIYWIFGLMEIEPDMTTYLSVYMFPIVGCLLVVLPIVYVITSKYFDKKEGTLPTVTQDTIEIDLKSFGVPMYYAILPLLPLIFVVIFGMLIKTITITISAASFASLFIAMIIDLLNRKNLKESMDIAFSFIKGMGDGLANLVFLFVVGVTFATAMDKVGGVYLIATWISKIGNNSFLVIVLATLLYCLVMGLTGAMEGSIYIFVPLMTQLAKQTGTDMVVVANLIIMTAGLAFYLSPATVVNLMLSGHTGIPVTKIVKRNIPISVAGILVVILYNWLFLA